MTGMRDGDPVDGLRCACEWEGLEPELSYRKVR